MPTNRTKRARHSQSLDYWRICTLIHGEMTLAGVGYGENQMHGCGHWTQQEWDDVNAAIRQDWQQYGSEFMAWWRGDTERFTAIYGAMGRTRDPKVIPWALTEFGEPLK